MTLLRFAKNIRKLVQKCYRPDLPITLLMVKLLQYNDQGDGSEFQLHELSQQEKKLRRKRKRYLDKEKVTVSTNTSFHQWQT